MDKEQLKEQLKTVLRTVINEKEEITADNDKWITIKPNGEENKGKHLLLKDGESPKEAIDRVYKKEDKKESDTKDGGESILDTIERRNRQAKELKEKGVLKDIKKPKTFEERQQEDIDKGELVELGKFPTKFTSEYEDYKPKDKQSESKGDKKAESDSIDEKIKKYEDKIPKAYKRDKVSKALWLYKNYHISGAEFAKIKDNAGKEKEQLRLFNNKEQEMTLLDELKKLITKVENTKGEDEMEIENEKVDKRKLIDEVAGIMKSAGCDDEIIRTAIGKMEKIGYDDSEKSADNCGKKVKNEETEEPKKDEKEVKEIKEEVKEDVENKCKNSVNNAKNDYFDKLNEIYNSASSQIKKEAQYVSIADREKAAEEYFKRD